MSGEQLQGDEQEGKNGKEWWVGVVGRKTIWTKRDDNTNETGKNYIALVSFIARHQSLSSAKPG